MPRHLRCGGQHDPHPPLLAPHDAQGDGGVTKPARFTQADIKRAMAGARQAGIPSPRLIIRPSGELEIVTGKPANDPLPDDEEDFDL